MRALLFVFGFLFFSASLLSQNDSTRKYTLGYNYGAGFMLTHSPTMAALANRHVHSNEIFIEQNTYGKKTWQQRYHFIKIGLLFKQYDLNNEQQLGNAFALAPYMRFNVINTNSYSLRFKASIGLGYIEKKFEVEDNYKNIAIGSHVNMFISATLVSSLKLSNTLHWNLGLGLDHLSNTGYQTPNLGINMPMLSTGLSADLGEKKRYQRIEEAPYERKEAYWQFTGGIGLNEINPPNENKYIASALSITREKKLNYKSSLGFGLDFFYNPAQKAFLEKNESPISSMENVQIGASVIHLLHFGKLIFTSQLSYYLKTENTELGKVYHVFGGRYPINDQINVFFYGKTHIDKAEYIITGIGYRLKHE